ncbi:MAG: hypothetical protein ACRD9L_20315, partial [Bryobacteraceae bacterium]
RLSGPWVEELRSQWAATTSEPKPGRRIIDLSEVTFIDESGEGLLDAMRRDGAEFMATGVDTKHILENLNTPEKPALRRCLAHLSPGRAAMCQFRAGRAVEQRDE